MFEELKRVLSQKYPGTWAGLRATSAAVHWKRHVLDDWWSTYVVRSHRQAITPYGFKLCAGNYIANRKMLAGEFELEEISTIQKHLTNAQVFLDIGANIGFYTCLARSMGKHAIAVEPQARNLQFLYANLLNNGWQDTEVYPMGLGDRTGVVTLYGASGPSASLISDWAGYSKRFTQIISITTLDILLGNRLDQTKILIKIDVEGAEYLVLCGGEKTLDLVPRPTWLVEICLNEYHPSGINPYYAATFELFWRHGYESRTADQKNRLVSALDVERWVAARSCDSGVINYLFVPVA